MLRDASVLVIDDEEIMRDILQTLLEREGATVSLAQSGEDLRCRRRRRHDARDQWH